MLSLSNSNSIKNQMQSLLKIKFYFHQKSNFIFQLKFYFNFISE